LSPLFAELTHLHYDPLYARSQAMHFHQWGSRAELGSQSLGQEAIDRLAETLLRQKVHSAEARGDFVKHGEK
jgi:tRNA 2-selenouridine synthase